MPLPARIEMNHPKIHPKLRYVEGASRRLARAILYAMVIRRQALQDDQGRQNRIEMAGEYLLTIAATSWYAERLERTAGHAEAWGLADKIFYHAQEEFEKAARELVRNEDGLLTDIGKQAANGQYSFLSKGIVKRNLNDFLPKSS